MHIWNWLKLNHLWCHQKVGWHGCVSCVFTGHPLHPLNVGTPLSALTPAPVMMAMCRAFANTLRKSARSAQTHTEYTHKHTLMLTHTEYMHKHTLMLTHTEYTHKHTLMLTHTEYTHKLTLMLTHRQHAANINIYSAVHYVTICPFSEVCTYEQLLLVSASNSFWWYRVMWRTDKHTSLSH